MISSFSFHSMPAFFQVGIKLVTTVRVLKFWSLYEYVNPENKPPCNIEAKNILLGKRHHHPSFLEYIFIICLPTFHGHLH